MHHVLSNNTQTCWVINKLVLTKFPITLFKFWTTKLFLTLLKMGISNQIANHNGFKKVCIEKCNDIDLPKDTLNYIYRLKTGTRKEHHYLVIHKDCNIYVQMHENEGVSFKAIRKINEQDIPRTITLTSKISCCIS